MIKRPTAITIFVLYLLIVFGTSIAGSLFGAIKALPPHSESTWLVLAIPKLAAFFAGIALWRMLRIGVWLWALSVLLEWILAIGMGVGYFPTLSVAFAVTTVIVAASVWVIYTNWDKLLPWNASSGIEGANHA